MSSSDEIVIDVKGLHKDFVLPHENVNSIKDVILHPLRQSSSETQHVLKGLDFQVKKGEFFGVVGRNGSGKSTLLKILAGTYQPSAGSVAVKGSLVPFIELGVGFNPELTGRDNVYLNGALLGFSRKEMMAMYDDIVEFAELDRFMDQKVKNYSSGMQVRLAFSIAIKAQTDVLLIDEVLAVGDANFQAKCYEYFHNLKKLKKTVVFISHDMEAVKEYCDRAIMIDSGKIINSGRPKDVSDLYTEVNLKRSTADLNKKNASTEDVKRWGDGRATINKVSTSINSKDSQVFKPSDKQIEVNIDFEVNEDIKSPVIGMVLHDAQGRLVFASNTNQLEYEIKKLDKDGKYRATYRIENVFTDGSYSVSCAVNNHDRTSPYSRVEEIHHFRVGGRTTKESLIHPKNSIELKKK